MSRQTIEGKVVEMPDGYEIEFDRAASGYVIRGGDGSVIEINGIRSFATELTAFRFLEMLVDQGGR